MYKSLQGIIFEGKIYLIEIYQNKIKTRHATL